MRPFRIVTHKRWLAESFAEFGAVQDFGFDIDPATAMDTLWWAPGAWVASARKAGVTLPLLSCGPSWLDTVPYEFRGRPVITMELQRMTNDEPVPSFVKLPEAKLDSCEARVYQTPRLADTWRQHGFPTNTLVQLQGVLEFVSEARFWVANGDIVADSLYRHRDWIWGAEDSPLPPLRRLLMRKMERFAELVIPEVPAPPGFVLDIGITSDGNPKVIEANAAWSSGPYDAEPAGVMKALTAAHDFDGQYPEWAWRHNPVFDTVGPLRTPGSAALRG